MCSLVKSKRGRPRTPGKNYSSDAERKRVERLRKQWLAELRASDECLYASVRIPWPEGVCSKDRPIRTLANEYRTRHPSPCATEAATEQEKHESPLRSKRYVNQTNRLVEGSFSPRSVRSGCKKAQIG